MRNTVRAIIPCAGYGTRMGMKPEQSKEMLIEPVSGKPVIEYSLQICKQYDLSPCIITRPEKTDLINYLLYKKNIRANLVEPEGEWMDTVLRSKGKWNTHNILILPDTRFSSWNVVNEIKSALSFGARSVLALHRVSDAKNWGIVEHYSIYEKPKGIDDGIEKWAWGLVGFHIDEGERVFGSLASTGKVELDNSSFQFLDTFKDITRTGRLT